MEKAATDPAFGQKQYADLAKRTIGAFGDSTNMTAIQYDAMSNVLEILQRIAAIRDQLKSGTSTGDMDSQIKAAQQKLDALKQGAPAAEKATEGIKAKLDETAAAVEAMSMSNFIAQIDLATDSMDELAKAAATVSASNGTGREMPAAHGGMAWLADGGRPRGTDVIPAMLSPGEMVMSAATTRRFATQLTAMNAGARPAYHSQGGHVTNIGDINVSVTGGPSGRQTARSIATELRRELRRGTSVLS
jgi:hypothetical protein